MPNELPLINIKPTSQFKRDLRDLSKKYRHIRIMKTYYFLISGINSLHL
jgi:hypothetical protein